MRMLSGQAGRWLALAGGLALAACATGDRPRAALAAAPTYPPYRATMAIPPPAPLSRPAPAGLARSIELTSRMFQGRVGIAVQSVEDRWSVQWNGDVRLPQQSVSKLWVAMTVLDQRDQGRLRLDDPVTLTRDDLTIFHQPIAYLALKPGGYQTTIGDLLNRALTMSDNTANDRLLRLTGGPSTVRDMIARKGLGDIRFGPGERLLQAGTAGLDWRAEYSLGNAFALARARLPAATRMAAFDQYVADPPDGAAPGAIAAALAKLKSGRILSADSTAWLLSTMESSKTGKMRLRGAVPPGWVFGHKTGTGQDLMGRTAGYNDVGILTAPDGKSYALAVMIGDSARPIRERQELMQSVVNAVVATHGGAGGTAAAMEIAP